MTDSNLTRDYEGGNVHAAPNYEDGGVWFSLRGHDHKLLSPDDARSLADAVDEHTDDTQNPPGFDNTDDVTDMLRQLADDVEAKCDEPNPEAYDDIALTDTGRVE